MNTAASLEVLHISCNTGTRALPDMSTLALASAGNALAPVLKLLLVQHFKTLANSILLKKFKA